MRLGWLSADSRPLVFWWLCSGDAEAGARGPSCADIIALFPKEIGELRTLT